MKLTAILLTVSLFQLSAKSFSQNISLSGKDMSLETVLSEIEKQSGFYLFYKHNEIKKAQPITLKLKNVPLKEALALTFKEQPFDYSIDNKTIIVTSKEEVQKSNAIPPVTVQGVVIDEKGITLPGASIRVKDTNIGVVSNLNGEFNLKNISDKAILVISYTGFATQEITVSGRKTLTIVLKEAQTSLNEVVVIGYGEVQRKDLTGSVSSVNIKDIENVPVPRVDQMLQGRIAGAEVISTTGEPGAKTSIRIRGTRSITATNEPLIVVDGVMDAISDLNELNPSDIKSIDVLKDASSTAIYGSRGSNGVILITTKSGGTNGKTNFTFRSDVGTSELPRFLDLMNAQEFAELQNDRYYHASAANKIKPLEEYPYPNPAALGEGTNWTKEITRTAPYQNYTFSAAGGDKSTTYYFSGNYNNNQGIIINSGMKRYQTRLNLDKTFNKYVKAGLRLNYSFVNQDINKADVGTNTLWYRSTIFLSPTMPAYKEDGSFNDWNTQWYSGTLFDSPLANSKLQRRDQMKKSLSSMLFAEVSPIKNVKVRSSVSFYDYNRFDDTFYPSSLPSRTSRNTGAYAYKSGYRANDILNENTINYKKTWNKKHSFDALYGFTFQSRKYANIAASGDGYFIDDINTNDLAAVPSKETLNASSSLEEQKRVSHLGRLNYNYAGKYYFTLTGRADAASNFAENHKWGYFPSAAFKWNIKKEDFFKDVKAIDAIALRLSGGVSGNDAISKYQSLSRLNSNANGYLFDGVTPVAYYPTRIQNEGLTWEKTTSYNAGLDVSVLDNRLDITVDYYRSYTTDLLLTVQLPSHSGYTSRIANIGETSNKGIELTLNSENISKKNFSWSSTLTFAHNDQMVDDIGGLDKISVYNNGWGAQYMMYGYVKGRPLNALWGMQYAGTWKSQAEIQQNDIDKKYASSATSYYSPGRQRYIDQNQDGILDNNDLVYLGDADPYLYGGIQNTFKIHKFNVSFYFNYSLGGSIYNPVEVFMGTGTYLSNQFKYMVNAWHPVRNPNSDYPRADSKDDIPNDRFVHDASFLRLKNVSLGYTFNMDKLTNKAIKSLTLSANGNNLYLWKHYNGYDPEVSTESEGSTIRRMDNGAYPTSRTVIFSAEIKF